MNTTSQILKEARYHLNQSGRTVYAVSVLLVISADVFVFLLSDILSILAGCAIYGMSFMDYTGTISTTDVYIVAVCIISVLMVLLIIFLMPLYTSMRRMAFIGARGRNIDSHCIFACFTSQERYIRSLRLIFNVLRPIILCFIISMLPSALCIVAQEYVYYDFLPILSIVLCLCGLIFTVLFSLRYIFADYIMFYGEKSAERAVRCSVRLFKHNRFRLFLLLIRLLPFMLLTLLIVPSLWTIPYIEESIAVFAQLIYGAEEMREKSPDYQPTSL